MHRPRQHRGPDTDAATLIDAMRATNGDAALAAASLGVGLSTLYQRLRRAGLKLAWVQFALKQEREGGPRAEVAQVSESAPVLEPDGQMVRLPLADYVLLRALAQGWQNAQPDELTKANRIIDTLERTIELLKEQLNGRSHGERTTPAMVTGAAPGHRRQ